MGMRLSLSLSSHAILDMRLSHPDQNAVWYYIRLVSSPLVPSSETPGIVVSAVTLIRISGSSDPTSPHASSLLALVLLYCCFRLLLINGLVHNVPILCPNCQNKY